MAFESNDAVLREARLYLDFLGHKLLLQTPGVVLDHSPLEVDFFHAAAVELLKRAFEGDFYISGRGSLFLGLALDGVTKQTSVVHLMREQVLVTEGVNASEFIFVYVI